MARLLPNVDTIAFLERHGRESVLSRYLSDGVPQWGVIVRENGRDFLVYVGGVNGVIYVIDVTGDPIALEVKKAPYRSPDDVGFWANLEAQIANVISGGTTLLTLMVAGLAAYAVITVVGKR